MKQAALARKHASPVPMPEHVTQVTAFQENIARLWCNVRVMGILGKSRHQATVSAPEAEWVSP